eukprot:Rhum_TRINITY_DN14483_c1_g2::Rhum_TRINITY_DN14483_c1_g2_i1::g.87467::m.87467
MRREPPHSSHDLTGQPVDKNVRVRNADVGTTNRLVNPLRGPEGNLLTEGVLCREDAHNLHAVPLEDVPALDALVDVRQQLVRVVHLRLALEAHGLQPLEDALAVRVHRRVDLGLHGVLLGDRVALCLEGRLVPLMVLGARVRHVVVLLLHGAVRLVAAQHVLPHDPPHHLHLRGVRLLLPLQEVKVVLEDAADPRVAGRVVVDHLHAAGDLLTQVGDGVLLPQHGEHRLGLRGRVEHGRRLHRRRRLLHAHLLRCRLQAVVTGVGLRRRPLHGTVAGRGDGGRRRGGEGEARLGTRGRREGEAGLRGGGRRGEGKATARGGRGEGGGGGGGRRGAAERERGVGNRGGVAERDGGGGGGAAEAEGGVRRGGGRSDGLEAAAGGEALGLHGAGVLADLAQHVDAFVVLQAAPVVVALHVNNVIGNEGLRVHRLVALGSHHRQARRLRLLATLGHEDDVVRDERSAHVLGRHGVDALDNVPRLALRLRRKLLVHLLPLPRQHVGLVRRPPGGVLQVRRPLLPEGAEAVHLGVVSHHRVRCLVQRHRRSRLSSHHCVVAVVYKRDQ